MADLTCTVCGKVNPVGQAVCQYCGASLPRGGQSFQPGQEPTRKSTSELEQALPSWLQEARGQSSSDELSPSRPTAAPASLGGMDLLAGLRAQAEDDDEELPDWLSNLGGGADAAKKPPSAPAGDRRADAGASSKPAEESEYEMPSWLSSLSAPAETPAPNPSSALNDLQAPPEESDTDWLSSLKSDASLGGEADAREDVDLPDWMKMDEPAAPPSQAAAGSASSMDTVDWLKGLEADTSAPAPSSLAMPQPSDDATFDDSPDWLKGLGADASAPAPSSLAMPQPSDDATFDDSPDWLKGLEADASAPAPSSLAMPQPSGDATFDDSPDWLKGLGADASAPAQPAPAADASDEGFFMPDWLKGAEQSAPAAPAGDADLPDWLKSAAPAAAAGDDVAMPDWLKGPSAPAQSPAGDLDDGLPTWLKNARMVEEKETPAIQPFAAPESAPPTDRPSPAFVPAFTDFSPDEASIIETPDWLAKLGQVSEPSGQFRPETSSPSIIPEEGEAEFERSAAGGAFDSLFTEMPDWLNPSSLPAPADKAGQPAEAADELSPASLPSWVEAMRPVDTVSSVLEAAAAGQTVETRGPFAGLVGVLPAIPYLGASSKPKPLAVKLQADDEQQSQAALLEQIMAAEANPEPMVTSAGVNSQRILRIVTFVLLLAVVAGALFMRTQIFPLPTGSPAGTMAAFNAVDSVLPPDAPVLLIFDYEPALAGEMEVVAAPLLDHMIVKKHPRMALLSTSPTGAVMAARMFAGPLGELPAVQYINLGYLPGGLSAVRAFALDPVNTLVLPADVSLFNLAPAPAWSSPVLQGVQSFSHFAAIILITDSAEAGRTWIEQAGPLRGDAQFVVVSSAQAGPLLQPYYASGQIDGLASGLHDAAVLEQNNAGRPGSARRYWDAYALSLALALVLLVAGALWSLTANLRERIASKEGRSS